MVVIFMRLGMNMVESSAVGIVLWKHGHELQQKALERKVIRAFIKYFHAPPVANGAGVWGWVIQK
jgi:hypothetical protein